MVARKLVARFRCTLRQEDLGYRGGPELEKEVRDMKKKKKKMDEVGDFLILRNKKRAVKDDFKDV